MNGKCKMEDNAQSKENVYCNSAGLQLYHNYFREHEGLDGKTPAEAANIKIEGQNKWITVIQNASRGN